jgi:hypothetical protein
MKTSKSSLFLTSGLLVNALSAHAQAVDEIGPNDNVHAAKAPIEFKPFPFKHPESGAPIVPQTIIRLPNGKAQTAQQYYSELNRIERDLNKLGYTLRSGDPVQIIAALTDNPELAAAVKKYDTLIRQFDSTYMKYIRDPELIRKEIEQELRDQAQRAVDELYEKAKKNLLPSEIVIEPIEGYMVNRVNNNLYVPWTRDWSFKAGNSNISAEANISARLGVDTNAYQVIGEAIVKGNLLGQGYDLASLGANLEGYEVPKDAKARPPGNYLEFQLQVVGLKRWVKVYDLSKETFNFKDLVDKAKAEVGLGDLIPKRPTPSTGKPLSHFLAGDEHRFRFVIGPIPCSATIGYAGSVGFDTKIASKFSGTQLDKGVNGTVQIPSAVTFSGSLNAGPAVYAEVYGSGAADIEVARAGFEASVVVIDTGVDVDVGANLSLDAKTFEPAVDLTMVSNYHLMALNGRAAGFAEAYVPAAKLPPWELKRWEHTIIDWQGYNRRGTIFNVTRHVTPHGETISGAPTNDDVKNIDVMEGIKSSFREAVNDISTNTQDKVTAGTQLIDTNNVATAAYFDWIASLGKKP